MYEQRTLNKCNYQKRIAKKLRTILKEFYKYVRDENCVKATVEQHCRKMGPRVRRQKLKDQHWINALVENRQQKTWQSCHSSRTVCETQVDKLIWKDRKIQEVICYIPELNANKSTCADDLWPRMVQKVSGEAAQYTIIRGKAGTWQMSLVYFKEGGKTCAVLQSHPPQYWENNGNCYSR